MQFTNANAFLGEPCNELEEESIADEFEVFNAISPKKGLPNADSRS